MDSMCLKMNQWYLALSQHRNVTSTLHKKLYNGGTAKNGDEIVAIIESTLR